MPKALDLTNQRFGRLIALKRIPNKNNKTYWRCKCNCGNIIDVRTDQLTSHTTQSCGCLAKETVVNTGHSNFKDITGQKFGKLTPISPYKGKNGKYYWICQCDCGNQVSVLGTSLRNGSTQSCGCLKSSGEADIELFLQTHNLSYKHEYEIKINNSIYKYDFALLTKDNQPYQFIEFDGIQHFGRISGWFTEERYIQTQYSDNIKTEYAKIHNIPLLRISYLEQSNINTILQQFI